MKNEVSPYNGLWTAGNDHYHGVQSLKENGALAHADRLARIYLREGKVGSEEEALSIANFEVQRLRWNAQGFQANHLARAELRAEREAKMAMAGQPVNGQYKPA